MVKSEYWQLCKSDTLILSPQLYVWTQWAQKRDMHGNRKWKIHACPSRAQHIKECGVKGRKLSRIELNKQARNYTVYFLSRDKARTEKIPDMFNMKAEMGKIRSVHIAFTALLWRNTLANQADDRLLLSEPITVTTNKNNKEPTC